MVVIVILAIAAYISYFSVGQLKEVPLKQSFDTLPETIGRWKQADRVILDDKIINILGVDEYIEKIYVSHDNQTIDLYVSHFNVLKEGKQFHSPKNCLIGSGSNLIKNSTVEIPLRNENTSVPVGFMVLQKGDRKQLILYWYQCRGRIMYSEYEERLYRVLDAILKKRTDGAFIRIISTTNREADIQNTKEILINFTTLLIPILNQYLPGS